MYHAFLTSPLRIVRRHPLSALLLLTLLLASCVQTSTPPLKVNQTTVEQLRPQPPQLPFFQVAPPLPELTGSIEIASSIQPAATPTTKYEMRILVVAADAADYGLSTAKTILDQVGVPYEVLFAGPDPLDEQLLYTDSGDGRFQGIILTSNNLAYFDGITWASALSPEEWNTLWAYERHFGIRQVALNSYPTNFPEDYGFRLAGVRDTSTGNYTARLTSDGRSTFDYLQRDVRIPIRYAYTYLAELDPATTSSNVRTQLVDASGNVLAISSTSTDGRERLALTMAHNPYLLHTQLLAYGLIDWVTKGVFIGERAMYFMADVDDWFLPNDVWQPATQSIQPDAYRLDERDITSLVLQQTYLRLRYPAARDYVATLAFNGEGANLSAPRTCLITRRNPDPLTSASYCLRDAFNWVNHSYSHQYFDFTDYTESAFEIAENRSVARHLRLAQPDSTLVTGDVSGLGWYNPNGDGPKIDNGLHYSNQQFLDAASDLGVSYVASNASVPSHVPDCSGCGTYHPLSPDILLVPRWPTNVFYSVTTPTELVNAYNSIYGPSGAMPYWDHDLSYQEFLDVETDTALYHVLSMSPYPHFFHVANVREYAAGRSILSDFLATLFDKYSDFVRVPLRSHDWAELGDHVAARTSHMNAEPMGVRDTTSNAVTITSAAGGTVFVTGVNGGRSSTYGNERISRFELSPNETITQTVN